MNDSRKICRLYEYTEIFSIFTYTHNECEINDMFEKVNKKLQVNIK